MAPPPLWTFCCDVVGSEAKKELTGDIQHLLQNGWNLTETNDGITKDFAFMSTDNALVSCTPMPSYTRLSVNNSGLLYTCQCEFYNTPSSCRPHAGKCDVSLFEIRAENPTYRQEKLRRLCGRLINLVKAFRDVIIIWP